MQPELMIDIETLGTRPGSKILSVGWCLFQGYRQVFHPSATEQGVYESVRSEPKILSHGQFALDLPQQDAAGLVEDPETVLWWKNLPTEANLALEVLQAEMTVTAEAAFAAISRLCEAADQVWANGPEIDIILLDEYFIATLGKRFPAKFWAWNQTRSVADLAEIVSGKDSKVLRPKPEIAHDAGHDCVAQSKWMLNCRAAVLGLPLPF